MTISSLVQQGHRNSGLLDAGPYSANQWAAWLAAFNTLDPISSAIRADYLNEFSGSNPGGSNIQIGSGAAMVNGRPTLMDAALTFAVPAPAANPRIDVLGLCLNNTGIARIAGIASGNAFLFPTDLTDYDGAAEIPPFTVRPVILTGTENAAPVAPTLDTDPATLFMIPVMQYEISVGGVVSDIFDLRRYHSLSQSSLIYKLEIENSLSYGEDIVLPQTFKSLKIDFEAHALTGKTIDFRLSINNVFVAGANFTQYTEMVNSVVTGYSTNNSLVAPTLSSASPGGWYISGELTIPFYSVPKQNHSFFGSYHASKEPRVFTTNKQGWFAGDQDITPAAAVPITVIGVGFQTNGGTVAGEVVYGRVKVTGVH